MNSIIYKNKFLFKLLKKLFILFNIFLKNNIFIKFSKFFFNYSNIRLLNQQVNFLNFFILEKKLKEIRYFIYLEILKVLKYYFGLTGYLQSYIYIYAEIAVFFQALKIFKFYNALVNSWQCQVYTFRFKFKPLFSQKLLVFQSIYNVLAYFSTFIYHNFDKTLQIDLDTKKFIF